ncbi:MAG: helix-turn-helix domain-containing protein [Clostridia bacterium]|nr:helix-turn-helix domain-containing protein [Clostridia bacterium]
MTLGEKIKIARSGAGLSQEQLAEKMGISRSAVAKWEVNNGMPDIDNLKMLSNLLGVTVDHLINDSENFEKATIKEEIDLSIYEGSKRDKKDAVVREKYPSAMIHALIAKRKLQKGEKATGELLGMHTDAPFGTAEFYRDLQNADNQYYLVVQQGKQFLVCVTSEFIISSELAINQYGKKFEIGNIKFTKCTYKVRERHKKGGNSMRKINSVMWGTALIAVGVIFALNALNITDVTLFFDGWWTLFIIVPCVIGLFTEREKIGNIVGILIGVFLLLCCQDILSFSFAWKLLVPAIIVIIGLKMIFAGLFGNKANEIFAKIKANGGETKTGCAIFSGQDINYDGQVFEGAEFSAIFGGIECNLKKSIIEKDCAIKIEAIFGGIDIFVPDNINVKVTSNCIFGGISNKTPVRKDVPTLYITGTCVFGGVDIK